MQLQPKKYSFFISQVEDQIKLLNYQLAIEVSRQNILALHNQSQHPQHAQLTQL